MVVEGISPAFPAIHVPVSIIIHKTLLLIAKTVCVTY